ncbi:MAG: hypothetical protein ABFD49_08665 [Armatimonadota bacterium]|nr:hypothetical protein [bacterium]
MAITITASEVKRKAMIGSVNYDTAITALITEMQGPLEYSIADAYINDTSNTNLQATLKLGMLEIITGEFIEQLRRQEGASEQFVAGGITIGASALRGVDLMEQGATRLAPYLKSALPMMSESGLTSSTIDTEAVLSADEEVW